MTASFASWLLEKVAENQPRLTCRLMQIPASFRRLCPKRDSLRWCSPGRTERSTVGRGVRPKAYRCAVCPVAGVSSNFGYMEGGEVRYRSAGVELFARSWGEEPPLVLLHGSGLATHAMYEPLARALQDSCRVVACDVRGFGKSVSRDPAAHTWGQYADDVVALLDHLGLATAVVGGYSFGAGVAVAVALRHPDRVAGLVLAGPGYAGLEIGQTERQRAVWASGRTFFERARRSGLAQSLLATATSDDDRELLRLWLAEHDDMSSC